MSNNTNETDVNGKNNDEKVEEALTAITLSETEKDDVKKFAKNAFVALTGNNPGDDFTPESMVELQMKVEKIIGEEKTKKILYELIGASRDSLLMAFVGMWPPKSDPFDMESQALSNNIDNLLRKLEIIEGEFTPVFI